MMPQTANNAPRQRGRSPASAGRPVDDLSAGPPIANPQNSTHRRKRSAAPFYPLLVTFAVSCFLGTLATDIAYWQTADMMWADFSDWLVTAGVVVGYVTILVTLIEVFGPRSAGLRRPTWPYAIGNIVTLILATLNMLVHTRDAWTSVVPWGLVLSATTVVVALVTGWVTRETYALHGTEVTA
jgi:uncharacterized membrane protein